MIYKGLNSDNLITFDERTLLYVMAIDLVFTVDTGAADTRYMTEEQKIKFAGDALDFNDVGWYIPEVEE